jgi:hypothetical protein
MPEREVPMPDDKTDRGAQDRARVSADQRYELDYLMKSRGITRERALALIKKHNGSREKIDQELDFG